MKWPSLLAGHAKAPLGLPAHLKYAMAFFALLALANLVI